MDKQIQALAEAWGTPGWTGARLAFAQAVGLELLAPGALPPVLQTTLYETLGELGAMAEDDSADLVAEVLVKVAALDRARAVWALSKGLLESDPTYDDAAGGTAWEILSAVSPIGLIASLAAGKVTPHQLAADAAGVAVTLGAVVAQGVSDALKVGAALIFGGGLGLYLLTRRRRRRD